MLPRLLLLLTAALCARAEMVDPLLHCQSEHWRLYKSSVQETVCVRLMFERKRFGQALQECASLNAKLLTFDRNSQKLAFVNQLVVSLFVDEPVTLWTYESDPTSPTSKAPAPEPSEWLVMKPNREPDRIRVASNSTDVPRLFACEAPAGLYEQAPRFTEQPQDLPIFSATAARRPGRQSPMIATYNCRAVGLPKPSLRWALVSGNSTARVSRIEAKRVASPSEPLKELQAERPAFFDLRIACSDGLCDVQESSQLVVFNPQLLDRRQRVACVASNDMGEVMSREAQTFVTSLRPFRSRQLRQFEVTAGSALRIPCGAQPQADTAAVEWFRREGDRLVGVAEFNERSAGGLQMSKATSELIVDFATVADSGEYVCRVFAPDGRVRQEHRDLRVILKVLPCKRDCDLTYKPLAVVPGFPAALSMNPMSDSVVRTGDDFLLECPCFGKRSSDERLTTAWNLTNPNFHQENILPVGASLLFRNAGARHSGLYACRCQRDGRRSPWRFVSVQVVPPAAPVKFSRAVVAKVNGRVTIGCRLPRLSGVWLTATPMRGGDALTNSDGDVEVTASDTGFDITFRRVKLEHAGTYGCRVTADYRRGWTDRDTFYTTLFVRS